MPTVAENAQRWSEHPWGQAGHEWSPGGTPAGTEFLWRRSIRPRIQSLLPAGTLLEIAPGFGRWTAYLLQECAALVGVDVTARCVEVCRSRFASGANAQFWVNDGASLPMVSDSSIDAAFSFDSLVHVEAPELSLYLHEMARTLKPGSAGFFHHSNLGAYADASTRAGPADIRQYGWRALTVSARMFRDACRDAGLVCLTQEVINWVMRGTRRMRGERVPLSDCFSLFMRPARPDARTTTTVYVNPAFVAEWDQVMLLAALYSVRRSQSADMNRTSRAASPSIARKLATAARIANTGGLRGLASVLRDRISESQDRWRSYARASLDGRLPGRRDPIIHALRRTRCPDCSARLETHGVALRCEACAATFLVSRAGGAVLNG